MILSMMALKSSAQRRCGARTALSARIREKRPKHADMAVRAPSAFVVEACCPKLRVNCGRRRAIDGGRKEGQKGTVMAEPIICQKAPVVQAVAPGEYWWCACGRSKEQPFCDGSHKGTGLGPKKVSV
ncbi:MAG TPA: CDGSH iron-sulfur domain-containing protein, partial [Verrucomicrobiae bacterium]|nr:CDGSH iron-sulfur domain-containing protein [Verrucomicrobiae bacterium]